MGLLRSLDIDLYQILIPKDNDWKIMNELGHLNCLHFIDLNKGEQPHHLRYTNQIKRAEESERRIADVEDFCLRYRVEMKSPNDIEQFLQQVKQITQQRGKAAHLLFNDIEADLEDKQKFLLRQGDSIDEMVSLYRTMLTKINVLNDAAKIFKLPIGRHDNESSPATEPLLTENNLRFSYMGGSIPREDQLRFKKLLFRTTRGKAYAQFFDMDIAKEDRLRGMTDYKDKAIYIVMFEEGRFLKDRIEKLCASFLEPLFEIKFSEIERELLTARRQKDETKVLIQQTKRQLKDYLVNINQIKDSEFSLIQVYKWFIIKERAIYTSLNMLKQGERLLMGLMWLPAKLRKTLDAKLEDIRQERNIDGPQIHLVKQDQDFVKPTYFETNDFTWPFQEIVNTYGIPAYKEINPAIFTIVTFPFLFGIMFGDVMHGTMLFVFATILCFSERKAGTIMGQLGQIRYLLLLMGFFSTFAGFIYNDFSSVPLTVFNGSCYVKDEHEQVHIKDKECIYPIGVDPIWYMSKNELTYMNSLKMKISVLLGVAQMSLGVFMKALNSLYFGRYIDFTFEFLPQIILLLCLFGFMDLLIVVKWLTNWGNTVGATPPSIISMMIQMCLNFGEPQTNDTALFSAQTQVMRVLLIIVIICVPIMLFVKPIYENSKQKAHHHLAIKTVDGEQQVYTAINEGGDDYDNYRKIDEGSKGDNFEDVLGSPSNKGAKSGGANHGFGELFIHQLIETIEFVLGTVSNTASYLRLWALSLAHSQLAKVFFDNTITAGLQSGSFVFLFFGFFAFISFTISVLMLMDLMEAFLHTLRLHWVEFQNKFYKGNGYKFAPFSIENTLRQEQQKEKRATIASERTKRRQAKGFK